MRKRLLFCLLVMSMNSLAIPSKVVQLTSMSWPPYSGVDLSEKGLVSSIIKKAYASVGYDMAVTFLPQMRAMRSLYSPTLQYQGFYPTYDCGDLKQSEPIAKSMIGFASRQDTPAKWETIDDLRGKHIGIAIGRPIPSELNDAIRRKIVHIREVVNDNAGLKMLMNKRINLLIMEKNVFKYALHSQPKFAKKLIFNQKTLSKQHIYACFATNFVGLESLHLLNEGLKKIDVEEETFNYILNYMPLDFSLMN